VPLQFSGIGSTRLSDAGVDVIHDYRNISVTGLSELFSKLGHIREAYALLKRHLIEVSPSLLILVDFPGFNLRVARIAKRLGIPTVYFIPPQIWAWRKNRINTIKSNVDLVLCILPFEEALYRQHDIPVSYIGHPYVKTVKPVYTREKFYSMFRIDPQRPVVTIMPGSRLNEARRHMPVMLKVIGHLEQKLKNVTVLLPVAPSVDASLFDPFIRHKSNIIPVSGLAYDCLKFSNVALIASGSSTLEAAILGVPSVVIYKISKFSYCVARMLVRVKHISLPNIIAEKELFPEFVQTLNPEKIAETMVYVLNNGELGIQKEMQKVRQRLTVPGLDSYDAAGKTINEFLERVYGPLPETA
jgi:lipid-A-disaccharide synthase